MAVPSYARSMLINYRAMFKTRYNTDCRLEDQTIWDILNHVYDDTSTEAQDNARVEEMKDQEGE